METAYDIIFFWVARMMMLGIHLTGEAPFHTVYLSGIVRDPYGQKMSKTKGNVVDPLESIDEFGADALRFSLINGTAPGNDLRLGREKLENGRNFANKLWNAARFVLGARPASIAPDSQREALDPARCGPAERWILSRASATVAAVDGAVVDYQFGEMTRLLYEAIWSEYCDWFLELAKIRLADERASTGEREATWWTLVEVLDTYLRLLHPVMPFLTEAIWEALPHRPDDPALLIVARWPVARAADPAAEAELSALVDLVRAVRNARSEAGLDPARWLPLDVALPPTLRPAFEVLGPAIERLARVRPVTVHSTRESLHAATGEAAPGGLSVITGDLEAVVGRGRADAAGEAAERARLGRELAEAERLLAAARARLADERFASRAPAAVVEGARARKDELAGRVARLRERIAALD
jgi:valyl-tRNA synthetase